jgi:hypothetical protein
MMMMFVVMFMMMIMKMINKECNRKQHSRTEGFRSVISIRNVIGNCTLEPKASDLSFQ